MTLLEAALDYAGHGRPVFPVRSNDKRPLTNNGFKDATTDAETIHAWWGEHPNANVGVPTGAESGFIVLDVDGDEGRESLAELEREHGEHHPERRRKPDRPLSQPHGPASEACAKYQTDRPHGRRARKDQRQQQRHSGGIERLQRSVQQIH